MSPLEKASHLSVILVSAVALVCLMPTVKDKLLPSEHDAAATKMLGQRLELPGAQWAPGATVLVAMTSRCPYCIASLPFYRELSAMALSSNGRLSVLIAATVADAGGVKTLLQESGVQPSQIVPSSFRALHVPGTPTLYVVDATGTVRWAHTGQMEDDVQKELVRFLKSRRTS